jgi:hypothetical protein
MCAGQLALLRRLSNERPWIAITVSTAWYALCLAVAAAGGLL